MKEKEKEKEKEIEKNSLLNKVKIGTLKKLHLFFTRDEINNKLRYPKKIYRLPFLLVF